jgi:hypothetical protein
MPARAMATRFLVIAALMFGWLSAGVGIAPASASALLVAAGPTPYRHDFTCPRTLVPQPNNTLVPCS